MDGKKNAEFVIPTQFVNKTRFKRRALFYY